MAVLSVVALTSRQAEKRERENAERLLAEGYEQLGRNELLTGRAGKAFAYLSEAERIHSTPSRRLLLGVASKSAIPRVLVPATQPHIMRVSPDGQWLAVVSAKSVTVWDCRTGVRQTTIPRERIDAVAFRPGAPQIALADATGLVELWDFRTEAVVRAFDYRLKDVRFVPARATTSAQTVRAWSLQERISALMS